MRHDDCQHVGELQLGCDGPCCDDEQATGFAPMHHVVVNNKWRYDTEGPKEFGWDYGRSMW